MARYEDFRVTDLHVEKIFVDGGTAAGAGLSPGIWGDCPISSMKADPTLGLFVMDDFPVVQATGFPYTLYTDTTDTFTSLTGQRGGVGRLALSGTDNDEEFVVYNQASGIVLMDAATDPFYDWWFEARLKPSQVAAEHGIFIGFAGATEVGVDLMNTNDMVLKVLNAVGFQIISDTAGAACAVIQTIHSKTSGARVAVDATAGTATVAWIKFGMKSVCGTVYFYLNGAQLDTSVKTTATNFPISVSMCPTFGVKIGSGAAENLDIDWWAAAQLRA
jgi:hypothetical protein